MPHTGCLKQQILSSYGDWEFQDQGACQQFSVKTFFLACRRPLSCCVLTWPFLSVCTCKQTSFSSYKSTNPIMRVLPVCVCVLSSVQLFEILWTVALQAPLSMVFSMNNTAVDCHFFYCFLLKFTSPEMEPSGREPQARARSPVCRWGMAERKMGHRQFLWQIKACD